MSTKSGKTTEFKFENTMEVDLKVTVVLKNNNEISKEKAADLIKKAVETIADDVQVKNVKVFQREV